MLLIFGLVQALHTFLNRDLEKERGLGSNGVGAQER
jgi:hypothetical protein